MTEGCRLKVRTSGDPCIVEVRSTRIGLARSVAVRLVVASARLRRRRGRRYRDGEEVAMSVAAPVTPARAGASRNAPLRRLLLLGNPNTGKTTLFNRLCGMRAKTANFPGTTTDLRVGRLQLPQSAGASEAFEVVDLPGLYSLKLDLPESKVAADAVAGADGQLPAAAIIVADATNLSRHLMLVGELSRAGLPFVVALNMIDLAHRRGLSFDLEKMSRAIGAPVIPIAARSGKGIDQLLATLPQVCAEGALRPREANHAVIAAEELELWAETVVAESVGGAGAVGSGSDTLLDRLDETFTHPFLGLVIFHLVMAALFWVIFAVASVPMDLIEAVFSNLGGFLEARMPAGAVRDLLVGGLIGGISGTVVFLPQICLLFFLITILEDTGYLARAAFVMDRLLCRFGLPGYAFVPLLSSHACAIPGILATRLIPDRHDRLATVLVAPFMSCSARLPVYVLLTNFLFADRPLLAGIAFAACYLLGAIAAMGSAFLVRRTLLPGKSRPMVLELPTLQVAFAPGRLRQCLRARLVVPAHRRHGDSRDLLRDVVALGLSEGGSTGGGDRAHGAGRDARGGRARRCRAPRCRGGRPRPLASAGSELRGPARPRCRAAVRAFGLRLAPDHGRAHRLRGARGLRLDARRPGGGAGRGGRRHPRADSPRETRRRHAPADHGDGRFAARLLRPGDAMSGDRRDRPTGDEELELGAAAVSLDDRRGLDRSVRGVSWTEARRDRLR